MKKVIGILALLVFAGNIASAELLKNFKYDGKIEVLGQVTNNAGDLDSDMKDKTSDADARVQINASFDLTDDVEAIVSAVKCNRQYGTASETVAAGTIDAFTFEQAYLNLKGVLGFDHKIGRQYYGNEGDLIIYAGPQSMPYMYNDGSNPLGVNGVDGYSGWYKNDKLSLHAVTFKTTENDNVGATFDDLDVNVNGIVGGYDLMEELNIGAYVYEQKTMRTGTTPNMTLDVVGVKADGKFMGFTYHGELAKNYGRKAAGINYTGSAFLARASYDLEVMGKWSFMGEMLRASGDKTSAAKDEDFTPLGSDYRPGMVFSGVYNAGLANLTTWNLGAKWNPEMIEKLTLGAKFYNFTPTEDAGLTYDSYGNEFDLCASWQHSETVGLNAYMGMFMPDSDYADTAPAFAWAAGNDDMATVMGAALTVKF